MEGHGKIDAFQYGYVAEGFLYVFQFQYHWLFSVAFFFHFLPSRKKSILRTDFPTDLVGILSSVFSSVKILSIEIYYQ